MFCTALICVPHRLSLHLEVEDISCPLCLFVMHEGFWYNIVQMLPTWYRCVSLNYSLLLYHTSCINPRSFSLAPDYTMQSKSVTFHIYVYQKQSLSCPLCNFLGYYSVFPQNISFSLWHAKAIFWGINHIIIMFSKNVDIII